MKNDISTFREAVRWISVTPEERSATTTYRTCGYPGHITSGNSTKFPFAKDYRGKLPRRKTRSRPDRVEEIHNRKGDTISEETGQSGTGHRGEDSKEVNEHQSRGTTGIMTVVIIMMLMRSICCGCCGRCGCCGCA